MISYEELKKFGKKTDEYGEYGLNIDYHGTPYVTGRDTTDYVERAQVDKDVDYHGTPFVSGRDTTNYVERAKIDKDVDYHGTPFVSGRDTTNYVERAQVDKDVDNHGMVAVSFPDAEKYGTSNPKILQLCRDLSESISFKPAAKELMSGLSDKAVKGIVLTRYIKTINKLERSYGVISDDIGLTIGTDLDMISFVLGEGRDLYGKGFNLSNKLGGEKPGNIMDMLEAYKKYLDIAGIDPMIERYESRLGKSVPAINYETGRPFAAKEYIDSIEQQALDLIKEQELTRQM